MVTTAIRYGGCADRLACLALLDGGGGATRLA